MRPNILLLDGSRVNVARSDAGMVALTGDKICLTIRKTAARRRLVTKWMVVLLCGVS
jgi:hypothetical protein